jgi:hypothetical protein
MLHELMGWEGPMTHRQFLTWRAWQAEEWNKPSRADYYARQAAGESRRSVMKDPRQAIDLNGLKIPFSVGNKVPVVDPVPRLTGDSAAAVAAAIRKHRLKEAGATVVEG